MHIPAHPALRRLATLVLAALLALPPGALARDEVDPYWEYRDEVGRGEFSYDDSQDIPWIENETEVLAMPRAENLSRVKMDQLPEGFELFVDKSRITVDPKDRVIRLWVWLRSSSGSESGSFEGYRCATGEYKVYAYANPQRDPPVTKANRPLWQHARESRYGNWRAELLGDYFCGIRGTRSARDIGQRLTGEFQIERFLSQ
jgi:hypothetical protein